MTDLWLVIGILWLVATAIVWWHYLRGGKGEVVQPIQDDTREKTNVALYKEQLAELESDLAEGNIEQENFEQLKLELDKSLLQDIDNDKKQQLANRGISVLWPIALSVFILGFSGVFYLQQDSHQQYQDALAGVGIEPSQGNAQQQEVERVRQLEIIVANEPENSRAWYTLAQSYVMVGAFDKALNAYDKVIAIEGDIADLYGSKAQTLYYMNGQQITPAVQAMVDKALALDELDSSTLILLGMDSYLNQNFAEAVKQWQRVIDSDRPNVNREALQQAIAEAQSLLTNGIPSMPAEQEPVVEGPELSLTVSLGDNVIDYLNQQEDKVVYIYATQTSGTRMPLAVVKIMASDLPTTIVLSNANAMSPQANLGSVERVNVYAVVSNMGSVGIKSGDYIAELLDVSHQSDAPINLTIDTLVE